MSENVLSREEWEKLYKAYLPVELESEGHTFDWHYLDNVFNAFGWPQKLSAELNDSIKRVMNFRPPYAKNSAPKQPLAKPGELAIQDVIANADQHRARRPAMSTLMEEVAEAILASRGKHEHPLRLELVQIAGICINMIRQIDETDGDSEANRQIRRLV